MIVTEPVSVLTGLPGSGKSTSINAVIQRLEQDRESYLLGAPTGKAARRLSEITGRSAMTVHRLLEYHPEGGFRYNETRKLPVKQVIIDEASMLDTELAAALCRAINPRYTRLCLTGDAYQLPSVGPGRVLGDIIESGVVPSVELTEVHRSAAESFVCRAAPLIKAGVRPDLSERPDFAYWQELPLEAVERAVLEAVSGVIAGHGVRPCVITPRRTSVGASTEALNPRLQMLLNPDGEPTPFKTGEGVVIRIGDTVLQRKNDYELGVFNGETGEVVQFHRRRKPDSNDFEDILVVQFEGHDLPIEMSRTSAFSLRLAYAISCHAAQGSQWPWLIVICHSSHGRMLTRQILYTMITRAMKGLILVGDDRGIGKALVTNAPQSRRTGLVARLKGELT